MDARTRRAYERRAADWIAARRPQRIKQTRVRAVADAAEPGAWVADIGCGPGWYSDVIERRGRRALCVDLSSAMLSRVREREPRAVPVLADAAALPIRRGALGGAVSINALQHLPFVQLPAALAELHGAVALNGAAALTLANLETRDKAATATEARRGWGAGRFADDEFGDRLFTFVSPDLARELVEGAGFSDVRVERGRSIWLWIRARRADTLPDYVAPKLKLLVCGLNPSVHAAKTGIPFGRPGNRFWPAAIAAGLADQGFAPFAALRQGMGLTDLVKRVTRSSSELTRDEYAAGMARVETLVQRFEPKAVCFVGLEGFRRVVDNNAKPGWLDTRFGGRPAYLMPSTSGLNAHAKPADLTRHLRAAASGPH